MLSYLRITSYTFSLWLALFLVFIVRSLVFALIINFIELKSRAFLLNSCLSFCSCQQIASEGCSTAAHMIV